MTSASDAGTSAAAARSTTRSFHALDYSFAVEADEPSATAYLDRVLAALAADARPAAHHYALDADAGRGWVVSLDGRQLEVSRTPAEALAHLLWHVNRSVVIRSAGYVLIHAAVASVGDRAVVLPAAAGSGKTTLVAGLVMSGMAYLSDEIAALDPATGLVHPYPKPLSVQRGSFDVLRDIAPHHHPPEAGNWAAGQWHVSPDDIRADAVGSPCRAGVVIVPRYAPDRPTEITPLTRAEALRLLVESCFNLEIHGAHGVRALARMVRTADCYRLSIRDLDEACRLVHDVAGSRPAESRDNVDS